MLSDTTTREQSPYWIQTLDGKRFDLLHCEPGDMDVSVIARVLARKCRFGGHCREFYSVAQHSVHVCDLVTERSDNPTRSLRMAALMHDAHEVYTGFGDVLRPAKQLVAKHFGSDVIKRQEGRIDVLLAERFRFDRCHLGVGRITDCDMVALATEARDVMDAPPVPWQSLPSPDPRPIQPLSIADSERLFLDRFYEITGGAEC